MNKNSLTFCVLPWLHVDLQTDGSCKSCCLSRQESIGSIKNQSLLEIMNSPLQKKLRNDMMSEVMNPACSECHFNEKVGIQSLRQRANQAFGEVALPETLEDGSISNHRFKYIGLRFSNVCNLSCVYCSSFYSSNIKDEHYAGVLKSFHNESELEKFIDNYCADIEAFDLMGGEAILDPLHNIFLELLIKKNLTKCTLVYTTNLSTDFTTRKDLEEKWKMFSRVQFLVSLDAQGELGERIRKGLRWTIAVKNLRWLREKFGDGSIMLQPTLTSLNINNLVSFIQYIIRHNLAPTDRISFNYLYKPEKFNIDSICKKNNEKVIDDINSLMKTLFVENDANKYNRLIKNLIEVKNRLRSSDQIGLSTSS